MVGKTAHDYRRMVGKTAHVFFTMSTCTMWFLHASVCFVLWSSFVGRNCDGWVLVDEGFGKVSSCRNCSFPVHDRSRNCDISRGNWDPETILCVKSSGKASWMQGCTGFRRLLTLRFVAPNCLAVIVSDCMRVSVRKAVITCVTKWWFLARR